jgi:hypothetical protein
MTKELMQSFAKQLCGQMADDLQHGQRTVDSNKEVQSSLR